MLSQSIDSINVSLFPEIMPIVRPIQALHRVLVFVANWPFRKHFLSEHFVQQDPKFSIRAMLLNLNDFMH